MELFSWSLRTFYILILLILYVLALKQSMARAKIYLAKIIEIEKRVATDQESHVFQCKWYSWKQRCPLSSKTIRFPNSNSIWKLLQFIEHYELNAIPRSDFTLPVAFLILYIQQFRCWESPLCWVFLLEAMITALYTREFPRHQNHTSAICQLNIRQGRVDAQIPPCGALRWGTLP